MLFDVLDTALGTATKVRLLRVFLLRVTAPVSAREAQRLAGIRSSRGLGQALAELEALGLVRRQTVGRAYAYTPNAEHDLHGALLDLFAREAERVDTLASLILDALESHDLQEEVRSVVLFGSNARYEARAQSDVDLLVVAATDASVQRVEEVLWGIAGNVESSMGVRLAPYVLAASRARERYAAGDPLMRSVEREGRGIVGDAFLEVVA